MITFKYTDNTKTIVSDSKGWSGLVGVLEVQEWIAAGNTPEPVDNPITLIPTVISMAQARLALLAANLLDIVEQNISNMPKATQIDWQFRQTVERNSPLVSTVAEALNLDSDALDVLFTAASKL